MALAINVLAENNVNDNDKLSKISAKSIKSEIAKIYLNIFNEKQINEIYNEIDSYTKFLQNTDKDLDIFADNLNNIANTYEKLFKFKQKIIDKNLRQLKIVQQISINIDKLITEINYKKDKYDKNSTNENEIEHRASMKYSLNQQIIFWKEYKKNHKNLRNKLKFYIENNNSFFKNLGYNIEEYKNTAEIIISSKNTNKLLINLNNASKRLTNSLAKVSNDLSDIKKLIKKLLELKI
jgi:hypothetical protein